MNKILRKFAILLVFTISTFIVLCLSGFAFYAQSITLQLTFFILVSSLVVALVSDWQKWVSLYRV